MFDVKHFREQMFKKCEQTFLFKIIEWSKDLLSVSRTGSSAGQRCAVRSSADQVRDRIDDALFADHSFGLFNKIHMRELFHIIMIAV